MKALNKITIFAAIVLMLLGTSQSAFADNGRHYRGGHEGKAHHNRHANRHGGRRYDQRYNRHNRHAYRHDRHRNNDRGAYLMGGIVLGSILTDLFHRQDDRQVTRRVISEPVVVDPAYSRRLIRDRSGNCFEKSYDRDGNEEVFEVSPAECAW
jgi:hypothetical protein